jgi:hypothetical protein
MKPYQLGIHDLSTLHGGERGQRREATWWTVERGRRTMDREDREERRYGHYQKKKIKTGFINNLAPVINRFEK